MASKSDGHLLNWGFGGFGGLRELGRVGECRGEGEDLEEEGGGWGGRKVRMKRGKGE